MSFICTVQPTIKVPSQIVSVPAGSEVTMECLVEAFPRSVNYWVKKNENNNKIDEPLLFSSEKYDVDQEDKLFRMHMKLRIKYLEKKDFGKYKCLAKNSMGEAEGDIQLHGE